jgi:hypothetical protein
MRAATRRKRGGPINYSDANNADVVPHRSISSPAAISAQPSSRARAAVNSAPAAPYTLTCKPLYVTVGQLSADDYDLEPIVGILLTADEPARELKLTESVRAAKIAPVVDLGGAGRDGQVGRNGHG